MQLIPVAGQAALKSQRHEIVDYEGTLCSLENIPSQVAFPVVQQGERAHSQMQQAARLTNPTKSSC
jgi:hypothetical protein